MRSLLAFWAGGAAAAEPQAGQRGLLAFWAGGAAAGADTTPPEPPPLPIAPAGRRIALRVRRDDEDAVLMLLAAEIAAGLIH